MKVKEKQFLISIKNSNSSISPKMASSILSFSPIYLNSSQFGHTKPSKSSSLSLPCKLLGNKLSIQTINSTSLIHKQRRPNLTIITFSLPTANPERMASKENAKWSARAIKAFAMGELQARKLIYMTTGTEAILMGILVEGTSRAATFLRANGITLFKVRDEAVKLLGKSDLFVAVPEHPPLTESAQRALDWAVDEKLKSGESGEINTTHLLLGIWTEKESAGHKILSALGFDDEKAAELAKSMDEDSVLTYR